MGVPRKGPNRKRLGKPIVWFYRLEPDGRESAFGVELKRLPKDITLFSERFKEVFEYLPEHEVLGRPLFDDRNIVIVGPRLDAPDTPFSSEAVSIARQIGFPEVTRVEQFHRYEIPDGVSREDFIKSLKYDNRLEAIYDAMPLTFQIIRRPPKVKFIDLLGKGRRVLNQFCERNNLGFRKEQLDAIEAIYRSYGKNPSNLALFNMSQTWSDHCWHILFMLTKATIDGVPMEGHLIDALVGPYKRIKGTDHDNTQIVLSDNASAVTGRRVPVLQPRRPGQPSEMIVVDVILHLLFSAETHNFPSQVAPYPGRATEIGGEIRDQLGAGRGSDVTHAGCLTIVGSLRFPNGYRIPGEIIRDREYTYPADKATPIEILIQGTEGWVNYANAFGKPLTLFEMYSGAIWRPRWRDGKIVFERIESLKPVCYGFGGGTIRDEHKRKRKPKKGWVIVRIGGGARPIGFCGGSGSSSTTGTNTAEFDRNAVQRGNPIEERSFYEVMRVCCMMGRRSPIEIVHDQGAGGLGNMTNELMGLAGGRLFLGAVTVDDPSMGDVKVYVAEWQESQGLLIREDRVQEFLAICARESCTADIIGYITGDGKLEVFHEASEQEVERKCAKAVYEILMKDLLSKTGEYQVEDVTPDIARLPLEVMDNGIAAALTNVLRRSEVGSVDWFLRCVDQTVGGQVVKGPYCGAYNTPISNYSIVALSNDITCRTGQATAIGTAPFATCLDVEAGARLSIGRLLTRLMLAGVKSLDDVKVLCNWMWPANLKPPDGEVALLWKATQAVRDVLTALVTAIIGGKDSSSMATWVQDLLVKSIETIVFSSCALVDDYTKHLTADIKHPGRSSLIRIDFARGSRRLGGSSFALAHEQLGDFAPDLDDTELLRRAMPVINELIQRGLVSAGLEIGQGGLAAAITKMCIAGGCGAIVRTAGNSYQGEYFAEELGLVLECPYGKLAELQAVLEAAGVPYEVLGRTNHDFITFYHNGQLLDCSDTATWRREWERTSHQIRRLLVNPREEDKEWHNTRVRHKMACVITAPPLYIPELKTRQKPWALNLRYRGTNGHQELSEIFHYIGFRVVDAHFNDVLEGRVSFDRFSILLGAGGWADMDVFGAAMGMYLRATRNPVVKENFERFLARDDTLTIGICNHAQFLLRMGIAPLPSLKDSRRRPLFTQIDYGRFNHQWVTVKVEDSPCVFTRNMAGSVLPVVVANGEGKFNCSEDILRQVIADNLVVFSYVDHLGRRTTAPGYSPSGSFVAAVTNKEREGRDLATMPHAIDRLWRVSRFSHAPDEMLEYVAASGNNDLSPYVHMPLNALEFLQGRN